jgi:hypothetical protein
MDEKLLLLVLRVFGNKIYELQVGFTAMFNVCVNSHAFNEKTFHREREKLEALPEFQKLRSSLDKLSKPTEYADLEKLLREYEGPVQ